MADVVLFHHALGRTPGIAHLAGRLSAAGHRVHTPDLFEGRVFGALDEGLAYVEGVGMDALLDRADAAVDALAARLVYAGMSLGVLPAQRLAQTRPGAAAAVLLEACVPATALAEGWPPGVAVQVHGKQDDPFFAGEGDLDAARQLVAEVGPAVRAELFTYPGDAHLFLDDSLPTYDAAAAGVAVERILDLLAHVDGALG